MSSAESLRAQELIGPGGQRAIERRSRILAIVDPQIIARAAVDAIERGLEIEEGR